jgi:tetratricopeptide (TPR) repeat protein
MKTIIKIIILSCLIAPAFINAQDVNIVQYLKQIEKGEVQEVKDRLIELKKSFPQSPNVMFLDGVLTENGQEAIEIYNNILEKYPQSTYADAALYRIYTYYYALGLYDSADKNLVRLKKDYPGSPYIKMAALNLVIDDENETQPNNETTVNTKIDDANYKFTVQAGAFTNAVNAASLKKEFEDAGMNAFIKEKNVGGTIFNVVYVGRFINRDEAENYLQIINSRFKLSGRVAELER